MHLNPRMLKIRRVAMTLSAALGLYAIYWYWTILNRIAWFMQRENFMTNGWVENHAPVTDLQIATFGMLWVPMVFASSFAFYFALRTTLHVYHGRILNAQTARCIQWLGAGLILSMFADSFLAYLWPVVMTWNNTGVDQIVDGVVVSEAVGFKPMQFFISNSLVTILLCGIGFVTLGWVLYEGALIEEENKGFV